MTDEQGYNGWTNYETWAANLHIDNDQQSQEYWMGAAREIIDYTAGNSTLTKRQRSEYRLSDRMKDEHEANAPEVSGVYQDLLNAALSEVHWDQIARHFINAAWTTDDEDAE